MIDTGEPIAIRRDAPPHHQASEQGSDPRIRDRAAWLLWRLDPERYGHLVEWSW